MDGRSEPSKLHGGTVVAALSNNWVARTVPARLSRHTVLRVLLGLFLLGVAGLKLVGRRDSLDGSFLSSPQLQFAALTAELIIGSWLLTGRYQRDAWMAAMALFLVFSGVSLYLTVAGQRSCPSCFGPIPVNPAITLALDLVILAALVLCRPAPAERIRRGAMVGTAAVVACALGGTLLLDRGTLASLRGESISVEPAVSDVGDGQAGEERTFTVRLTNHAGKAIRITGVARNCGSVATDDLPITLQPGESRSITVRMLFSGSLGRFTHRVTLYTDDDKQPIVNPRFTGRVIAPN